MVLVLQISPLHKTLLTASPVYHNAHGPFSKKRCVYRQAGLLKVMFLKEYYEIVDEARPLSGFFPHTY